MRRKRQSLYKICGVILGISCLMSACHGSGQNAEEAFTRIEEVQTEEESLEVTDETENPETETSALEEANGQEQKNPIWVYVCGQVVNPGVYELTEGDRITHAIAAAGGLTAEAGEVYLNQAAHLEDGQKIYVPSREEEASMAEEIQNSAPESSLSSETESGQKVNLNTASKAELTGLNGIGESRADAIIAYREQNGRFKSVEELKKIDGIKDGIFNKIKDQITVE